METLNERMQAMATSRWPVNFPAETHVNGSRWVVSSDGISLVAVRGALAEGVDLHPEPRDVPAFVTAMLAAADGRDVSPLGDLLAFLGSRPAPVPHTCVICTNCDGEGQIECLTCEHTNDCDWCRGDGATGKYTCAGCKSPSKKASPCVWHGGLVDRLVLSDAIALIQPDDGEVRTGAEDVDAPRGILHSAFVHGGDWFALAMGLTHADESDGRLPVWPLVASTEAA